MSDEFRYVWAWRERLGMPCLGGDRVGQRCRVVVRGRGNSAWVEFEDGFNACVSRNGLRRVEVGFVKPVMPREGRPDVVLVGPPGIGDLPAMRVDGGGFFSEWTLSLEERRAIADGARVHLWVLSAGHPPVSLEVEGVDYVGGDAG